MPYFDLYDTARTSTEFRNKTSRIMNNLLTAGKSKDSKAMMHHMSEMLKVCECNAGLLVPFFFPRYPKDEPMSLWTRPHTFAMMSFTGPGSLTVRASRQTGKCVTADTKVKARVHNKEQTLTIEELFYLAKSLQHNHPTVSA